MDGSGVLESIKILLPSRPDLKWLIKLCFVQNWNNGERRAAVPAFFPGAVDGETKND